MKATYTIENHPQRTDADFEYLSTKGYTDEVILAIWDRDLRQGKAPAQVNKYAIDWSKKSIINPDNRRG